MYLAGILATNSAPYIRRQIVRLGILWLAGAFALCVYPLRAQPKINGLQAHYTNVPLEVILQDLHKRYGLRFAYSPKYIPVQQPVSLHIQYATLQEALNELFSPLPVQYQFIGDQIVLRYHPKPGPTTLRSSALPDEVPQKSPLYTDPRQQALLEDRQKKIQEELPALTRQLELKPASSSATSAHPTEALNQYRTKMDASPASESTQKQPTSRLAQISLLPYLGTNALQSYRISNRISMNLLWGLNGGVNGLEIGGLVNHILFDVKGIQLAGAANLVKDDLTGVQASALFNRVSDTIQGIQISGLVNMAGKAYAIQSAGLLNIAEFDFSGIQAAGVLNYCGGSTTGIQLGGIGNISNGTVKAQAASLFNIAGDVESGQLSMLFNKGKHVQKYQIGLINHADTLSGLPIGFLNLIRKGYNHYEIGTGETFHGNIALKLGVPRLYNIFFLGGRLDDDFTTTSTPDKIWTWGLGYGLGTTLKTGLNTLFNLEVITSHINEQTTWSNQLNQLQQLRITWDTRIGHHLHIYLGPVANHLITRRINPETGSLQSFFAPYRWYEYSQEGKATHQFWGGITAGIRFW